MVRTEAVTWTMVNEAFSPFAETCLYAIRADTFFHFALRNTDTRRFYAKNFSYPLALAWRARKFSFPRELPRGGEYLFVSDYAAEPGFGSIRPLLASCPEPATVVVNASVCASRASELAQTRASVICADAYCMTSRNQWQGLWQRSGLDYQRLLACAPGTMRRAVTASQLVLRALLVRAYLYERLYERMFWVEKPRAVITHNDFTSLSYLAGWMARRYGVPDFTLQHGFPSQEYFPATASHYLLWGDAFREPFQAPLNPPSNHKTRFVCVGAPRLDASISSKQKKSTKKEETGGHGGRLRVLFLSQSHTPAFSAEEHGRILGVVSALAQEPWLHLVVKLHPQESQRAFRSHSGFHHASFTLPGMSLLEAIRTCDVALSVNSTAMLEAALVEVPVVQLALPGLEDRLDVLRFPLQVRDLVSARAVLQDLCRPEERRFCVLNQQALVRACIHAPGSGTETAWRYIRAFSGDGSPQELAASQGAGGCI